MESDMCQLSPIADVECKPPRKELLKSFFDLPFNIRLRIYTLCGLKTLTQQQSSANRLSDVCVIRRCPGYRLFRAALEGRALEPWLRGNNVRFDSFDVRWEPCRCYIRRGYGMSFLLTSKRVNDEVHKMLYDDQTRPGDLSPGDGGYERLKNFSISKLRNLKELSMQLNLSSHFGRPCGCGLCSSGRSRLKQGVIEQLDHTTSRVVNYHEREIHEFRHLMEFLAAHVTPGQLSFTLDLNADCEFAAKELLRILLQLPRLKDCAIRFRNEQNIAVRQLIRWTVQNLTSIPASFAHFGALPTEIKTLILRKTALHPTVTHKWHSGMKTFGSSRCCTRCSRGHAKFNCFCSFRAAYSTWCQCWNIPHELFAVSKEMRHLAAEVFFTSKRIFLTRNKQLVDHIPSLRTIFQVIPNNLLRYIRHLHIDLSLDQYATRELVTPTELEADFIPSWKMFISQLWKYCDVGKMTITLDLTQRLRSMIQSHPYRASDQSYHEDDEKAWPLYVSLVEAMRDTIHELQSCDISSVDSATTQKTPTALPQNIYVHISSPMHLRHSSIRHENERNLERVVMGAEYDSGVAIGKEKKTNFPQYQVLDYYCQGIEDAYWRKVNEIGTERSSEVYSDLALITDHIEGCEMCHGRPPKYSMAPRTGWEQECTNKWEWWTLEEVWRKKTANPSDKGNYAITRYQELQLSLT